MSRDLYNHHAEGAGKDGTLGFAFHGTGGDERQLLPLVRDLLPEAAIVAPRGDVSEHGAARFFRRLGEGIYDMADLARATARMGAFIEAHVAAAQPDRVIGIGYSNGANILASVIFARPRRFDAAVLMHPRIPWVPEPAPIRTAVLITAGARDPICPPDATRALAGWLQEQGAAVETHWQPGGHEVDRSEFAAAARFLGTSVAAGAV